MRPSRAPLISVPGGPRGSYNHQGVRRAPIGWNQPVKRNRQFAQPCRTILHAASFSYLNFWHVSRILKLIWSLRAPQTSDGPRNSSVASPQNSSTKITKNIWSPISRFPSGFIYSCQICRFSRKNPILYAANPGNGRLRGPGGPREYSHANRAQSDLEPFQIAMP